MDGFAVVLRALMTERGISANAPARQVPCDKALISRYRSGQQPPSQRMAGLLDDALGAGGQLTAAARRGQLDIGDSGTDPLAAGCHYLPRRA